jgi:16S rRNA (cytosine1402-N4)-methyltransferase
MNATMTLEKVKHYPVMLDQILSIISPQHGGTFIDCTFGGGCFSQALLHFPTSKVIAIDRDTLTREYAKPLERKYPERFSFFQEKFSNLSSLVKENLNPKAIIFDLGLSSFQLADKERGFSFESKNFLNMEMGIIQSSAYKVVNTLDKNDLATVIRILGEEKDGRRIANKINKHRNIKPIKTSEELAKIIKEAKRTYKNFKRNPATKTFQAIRIFVNKELTELMTGLIEASKILSEDGKLIIVSFHSLEDKIVKNFFNLHSSLTKNPSRYLPIKEKKNSLFKLISKKALIPSSKELNSNTRSRSAKLRYAIRNKNLFFDSNEFENKFSNYFKLENGKI